jgi:1,2-dihydroxy-3-keto-5-methylthiopentene dioxygenase
MSRLTVYADTDPKTPLLDTRDGEAIAEVLAAIAVSFERWPARAALSPSTSDAEILALYGSEIASLKDRGGYQAVDVARMQPDHPDRAAIRTKFLSEHRHDEDEVRFFVDGAGLFCLREGGKVYLALCEAGDMISVPGGIRHWFDMGEHPRFTAVRLFTSPQGWVARYTGDPIAETFPRLEPSLA